MEVQRYQIPAGRPERIKKSRWLAPGLKKREAASCEAASGEGVQRAICGRWKRACGALTYFTNVISCTR
jgi:hypothetical protein